MFSLRPPIASGRRLGSAHGARGSPLDSARELPKMNGTIHYRDARKRSDDRGDGY